MTTTPITPTNPGAVTSASGHLSQAARELERRAFQAGGKRRQMLLLLCERQRSAVPAVRKLESR